jgi:hypothetical protein
VGYQEAVARLERGGSVEIRTGDGDLDAIIEKCIKVKPDERPSMRDFENMLFEYLEKRRKNLNTIFRSPTSMRAEPAFFPL